MCHKSCTFLCVIIKWKLFLSLSNCKQRGWSPDQHFIYFQEVKIYHLDSSHHCGIIQLLEVKPDSWLGWFPWFLKACLESHHHHVMVASNICTWECSGSGNFNTWTEPFLHQGVLSIWLWCVVLSIFWMAYVCLGCLPTQGCCRLRSLGAWALCHWSPDCRKVHKLLPNLLVHRLQLSRSNHLVQPVCPVWCLIN